MRSLILISFAFFAIGAQAQRTPRIIPYPCDSLRSLPKTTPKVFDKPNDKVFMFTVPESVLTSPGDTVCFLNEALIIKKGSTFVEMRTADWKGGFNRYIKTPKGVILYKYPPPKRIDRA